MGIWPDVNGMNEIGRKLSLKFQGLGEAGRWAMTAGLLLAACGLASPAAADCTVEEVREAYEKHVEDGTDAAQLRKQIKKDCDYRVETQSCTLKKVVDLIEEGLEEDEIETYCMK